MMSQTVLQYDTQKSIEGFRTNCYNLSLSNKSKEKPYIEFIQRELDEVPVTKCLSYIYLANDLCYTKPSLF